MAGIININSNFNTRRISNRLSFEVGEVFSARIINSNKNGSEFTLKLIDGWQFSANTEVPLSYIPEGLIRFQVEDYKDGKLQIKLLENKKNEEKAKDSIENTLEDQKINLEKEDYNVLEKMVKCNMPLTKENISKVKTIIEFRNKFMMDDKEKENFITKYIRYKGIDSESPEGHEIKDILVDFIEELNSLNEDDILTLFENGIEFTAENIKSFNKIFKDGKSVYEELLELKEHIGLGYEAKSGKAELERSYLDLIKEEFKAKTEAVKDIINLIIEKKNSDNVNSLNELITKLKVNTNDFKIFNSVSNQYYYLDIPVDIRDSRYDCRLIIRDNRKAEKKIDSRNVKLVVSISTINLGCIDAYITFNNQNINIDFKSDEGVIYLLSKGKDHLQDEIKELGYNVYINFDKRQKEVNLVNCREFFEDRNLGSINVIV